MITAFWNAIGEVVTGGVEVFVNLFQGVLGIFWNTGAEGVSNFTNFGYLLLIVVGTPLIGWGLNWIIGLIRGIRLTRGARK